MKVLLALLKGIIAVYLILIGLIGAYTFTQKELYENVFPFIQDYAYYKIENDEYEPDFQKNDYVIVKKGDDVKENDYIIYIENKNIIRFKKVTSKNGSLLILKNPNSEEQETIDLKNVLAVSTHESDLVSFLLRWLTEPVIVIIIFVIAILLPEVKYRRID